MSILQDKLTNIATAIRNKKGTINPIAAIDFPSEILSIPNKADREPYKYNGNVDRVGLAALGYNEEEIDWFQSVVNWNAKDDEYNKVPQANLDLAGATASQVSSLKKSVMYLPKSVFEGTTEFSVAINGSPIKALYVPQNITSITGNTFGCKALYAVKIKGNVTYLRTSFCRQCSALYIVELPESLEQIDDYAFEGCIPLQHINIPDTIKTMGQYSFSGAIGANVVLPKEDAKLQDYLFSNNKNIKSIEIPNTVTSIGSYVLGFSSLEELNIPDSVLTIGSFPQLSQLKRLKLPMNLSGMYSLGGYNSLPSITLPSSITEIASNTFNENYSLTALKIPGTVTTLGSGFLQSCISLIKLDLTEHTSVPALGGNPWTYTDYHNPNLKILVPAALLPDFQVATNWSAFSSYMVGV